MPEKPVFGHFLEILSFVFPDFFAQGCGLGMLKTWSSLISEQKNFPAKNAGNMSEIAVFADFHGLFSLYFVVLSKKNVIDNNANYQAWLNCQ